MKILRPRQAAEKLGISRQHLYTLTRRGLVPQPIKLGVSSVGWIEDELDEWIAKRARERETNTRGNRSRPRRSGGATS